MRAVLPTPPRLTSPPRMLFNPATLAYLGDAVWELVVRQDVMAQHGVDQHQATAKPASRQGRTFVAPVRQDVRRLHLAASSKANAVQQAAYHDVLLSQQEVKAAQAPTQQPAQTQQPPQPMQPTQPFPLTAEEVDIMRWARNSSAVSPPKGTDRLAYKKATALEALVAHLYLTDPNRCTLLIRHLIGT